MKLFSSKTKLLVLALLMPIAVAKSAELPGLLFGEAGVDASGSALYTIPLTAVPGTSGMQPKLSLAYSSRAPNSAYGVGWSLSGLSSINRVGTNEHFENPATDYVHMGDQYRIHGLDFGSEDRLVLDGQRLILTYGSYGANGSTYRTENERFVEVTAHGSSGSGSPMPSHFVVRTKDGLTMTYGSTADARIEATGRSDVVAWALNKVEDTTGNEMTFHYIEDGANGEYRIDEILYSWSPSASAYTANSVKFHYETKIGNREVYSMYAAGSQTRSSQRVYLIEMKEGSSVARHYELDYDSASGVSRLKSVQLHSGGDTLPETVFQYSDLGASQTQPITQVSQNGGKQTSRFFYGPAPADTDGDGRVELHDSENKIFYYDDASDAMQVRYVTSAFSNAANGLADDEYIFDNIRSKTGDFNGDGITDFIVGSWENAVYYVDYEEETVAPSPGSYGELEIVADLVWRIFLSRLDSSGDPYLDESHSIVLSQGESIFYEDASVGSSVYREDLLRFAEFVTGDVNGDGRSDMVKWNEFTGDYELYLATYAPGGEEVTFIESPSSTLTIPSSGSRSNESWNLLDFNGDGMLDLQIMYANSSASREVRVYLSEGDRFASASQTPLVFPYGFYLNDQLHQADVNGDGLSDLVFRDIGDNRTYIYVYFSNGQQFIASPHNYDPITTLSKLNYDGNDTAAIDQKTISADVNADGLTDFVVFREVSGNTRYHVFYSDGEGLGSSYVPNSSFIATGFPWNAKDIVMPLDFSGDGLVDFALLQEEDLITYSRYEVELFENQNTMPNLLARVEDGLGALATFDYLPISDSTVYTRSFGEAYPIASAQGSLYVVSEYGRDNGLGMSGNDASKTRYTYAAGYNHQFGRGFQGFASFESHDVPNDRSVLQTIAVGYPYAGMSLRSETVVAGQTLNIVDNKLDCVTIAHPSGNETCFPYTLASLTRAFETGVNAIGSPYVGSHITNQYDSYGNNLKIVIENYANPVQSVSDPTELSGGTLEFRSTVTSIYENDTTNWHLGRLLFSKNRSETFGANADIQIRQSAFKYDQTNGLLLEEVLQPTNPSSFDVSGAFAAAPIEAQPESGGYDYAARWELKTAYQYDGFGNIRFTTVSSPATGVHSFGARMTESQYDATGRYVIKSIDPLGFESDTVYYIASEHHDTSLVKKIIGINDLETTFEYDSFGRVTKETDPNNVSIVTQRYGASSLPSGYRTSGDATALAIVSYSEKSGTRLSHDATVYSDRLGRTLREKNVNGDGETIYADTYYSVRGHAEQVSDPYAASGGTPYYTFATIDEQGRPTGGNREIENLSGGKITVTSKIEYNGFETIVTADEAGSDPQTTRTLRNAKREPVEVIDAHSNSIRYVYDARGNLEETIDPNGNKVIIGYDFHDNKTHMNDPDAGYWDYDYDALGQLVEQTDAVGNVTTLDYDAFGRLVSRTVSPADGSTIQNWSWTYDSAPGKGNGKIASESGVDGYQKSYAYDTLGRPSSVSETIGGKNFVSSTSYDSFGRLEYLTYPDGFQARNHYDPSNYDLFKVTDSDSHTWFEAVDYDHKGRLIEYRLAGGNIVQENFILDGSNYIERVRATALSVTRLNMSYSYDNHGNVLSRADDTRSLSETFEYDSLNRLTHRNSSVIASYDDLGNITSKSGVSGNFDYASTRPHAVTSAGGKSYQYDANGNIVSRDGEAIWWNASNRVKALLSDSASYNFYYDNDHNRVLEAIHNDGESRVKIRVGSLYEEESEEIGFIARRYVATPAGVVGMSEDVANVGVSRKYFLNDSLGSSSVVADQNGAILAEYSYGVWGSPRDPQTWSPLGQWPDYLADRGYTGHEMLEGMELVHMNGRIFDPFTSRMLSPDPYVQAEGNLQNYNRYSYVLNNPLRYTDPTGNLFVEATVFALATTGVEVTVAQAVWLIAGAAFVDAYFASGGDFGVALKSAAIAGLSAFATHAIGDWFSDEGILREAMSGSEGLIPVTKAVFHGVRGGLAAELGGGDFGSAFGAAFFGDYAGGIAHGQGLTPGMRVIVGGLVGGTASAIGGGKFANGAVSGAITLMLNQNKHEPEKARSRDPLPGDVRNYQVTGADVTFEGQTGEEFLEELAVPAAVISGLLVVGSAPVGPAMSKTTGEVIANGIGEGAKTAIGESSSAPGLGDAIAGLPKIVENRWQLREVRRMTSNLEIRVNATWQVYEKNKFLWFDGWSERSGTFLFDAGHRGNAQPADFERAREAARNNFLN